MLEGAPGRIVGDRYQIVRELGRGGMGVVYLGRDLRRDMEVAIKFRSVSHSDGALWLKREFRAVSSLRHPNLVELYELVAHDRACYFTMEYLPGIDPRRWVQRKSPTIAPIVPRLDPASSIETTRTVPPLEQAPTEETGPALTASVTSRPAPLVEFARVRAVLCQLAEGLAFLHACGVIHRDVKPGNAIVVDGTVKLLDFGLAIERRRQAEDLARESRVVGTAAYLAPEYLEKLNVSPAMDVYALGVLAYELVTGSPPLGGTLHVLARLQRSVDVPRASTLVPLPDDLDELIASMLAHDPAHRPTATEIAVQLSGSGSRPHAQRRAPRFVGRAAELARLRAAIEDPAPRGRLVLVTGASGAGKTSLIEEACRGYDADTLVWRGRCHERERVPYRAFDAIIDDLATELGGDPALASGIEHLAALARVFPVLAPVIDVVAGAPAADAAPAGDLRVERERALLAMVELFRRLLRGQRGVVVIDDLQWSDDDSLELLALLVERVGRPLTVIASWTVDGASIASDGMRALFDRLGDAAALVDVPAMSDQELAQVIANLAPHTPLARLVAAAHLAAGNPYLAELLGQELGDTSDARSPELRDLHDAEVRRLARLDPTERVVAEVASVATGAVSFEQLRTIAGLPSSRLHSVLRGLEEARIVRATPSPSGDPVYVFYHQRLRDAAHAELDAGARRALHEKLARWHEAGSSEPDQLAYHWQHAGDATRAAVWAVLAGDAAFAQLAWGLAADWYRKALELGAPDLVQQPAQRPRAKLAESLFLGGKLAEAAEQFLVLARGEGGDRWRVRAAEAYLKLGELDRGLGVLDDVLERRGQRRSKIRALSILRAAVVGVRWLAPVPVRPQPVDDVLAAAYRVIASFVSTPYPIDALEYVLRGVALAERTRDDAAHSQGMAMLAAYLGAASLGRFGDRAIASAERLAVASGAPYPRMVTAGCAGILAMLRGDWAAMRSAHETGEQICRRLGLERSWEASFLRSYWALGELYAGDPARALAMLDELIDSADDLFGRAMLGSYRGRALVLAGDLRAARDQLRKLERAPVAQRGMAGIYHQVFAAELALAEHDWSLAAALADELAGSAKAQWLSAMPAVSAMIDVISATADLGRARADRGAADRARTTAKRLARRGRASFYAVTAARLEAQAERLLGDDAAADRTLARAAMLAASRGGQVDRLAIAALSGAPIDAGVLAAAVTWSTGGAV
ncbi:MAG TPA: protein kinase [Kofleriaceae bacterium]|nr:protein kinase [Kofleriaceae bacterium]